jgi:hypothetical protein
MPPAAAKGIIILPHDVAYSGLAACSSSTVDSFAGAWLACLAPLPLQCLPVTPAVPSPSRVTYKCPKSSDPSSTDPWTPGTFSLSLTATAGSATCGGQGPATAQFVVTRKPVVTVGAVDPQNSITFCEDYGVYYVDVTFDVQADDPRVDLDLPPIIEASDGRSCSLSSRNTPQGPGKCGCAFEAVHGMSRGCHGVQGCCVEHSFAGVTVAAHSATWTCGQNTMLGTPIA